MHKKCSDFVRGCSAPIYDLNPGGLSNTEPVVSNSVDGVMTTTKEHVPLQSESGNDGRNFGLTTEDINY